MILCLDVGNTQIFGGVFHENKIVLRFRHATKSGSSSDQFGIFLKSVIRENGYDPQQIKRIAICSVVPHVDYSLTAACKKYFAINPFFLQAGVKTGLKIKYRNPLEVGADRIANAVAAAHLFPNKNKIIVDFGTATTFCAVTAGKEYLGGVILAGLRTSMEALQHNAAKLPPVEILRCHSVLGRSTKESIQSGLYYGHLASVRAISRDIAKEVFGDQTPLLIGTGGFVNLFENEKLFDEVSPDLVLHGLQATWNLNDGTYQDAVAALSPS